MKTLRLSAFLISFFLSCPPAWATLIMAIYNSNTLYVASDSLATSHEKTNKYKLHKEHARTFTDGKDLGLIGEPYVIYKITTNGVAKIN
jgi:hypothetical protein